MPPGAGGVPPDQQIKCPSGYALAMENGVYFCKNLKQSQGDRSEIEPERVDPQVVPIDGGMKHGGEVMASKGIGSFFPSEFLEEMGPGLVSSRERTYTYPSGVTVEETQSTGRFMFGDR